MICTDEMNKSTCSGDSGGPLLANIDGKFTLVGVTSWGTTRECSGPDHYGVYADISERSMLDFISQIN